MQNKVCSIYISGVTVSCSSVGAVPVPLGQHAQLQTPLPQPPEAPRAQRLQWEGLSLGPGPDPRLPGGKHRGRDCRGGGQPGQSHKGQALPIVPFTHTVVAG